MAYRNIKVDEGRSKAGNGRRLTPKMLSFIDAYFGVAAFNALEAIRLSDYQCATQASISQTAAELMLHPLVIAEIKRRNDLRTEKSEIKAEYLLNKLIEIIDNAEDSEKTTDRLRAIELAGKAIALWKERQEISGPDGQAIQHEQKVKEDVADFTSRITGLAKRSGTSNVVSLHGPGDPSGS